MLNFTEHANQVLDQSCSAPRPILLRAKVAAGLDEGPRSVVTPYLLNDLGVRINRDAGIYYGECVRLGLVYDSHSNDKSEKFISEHDFSEYGFLAENYVQFIGDYKSAARSIGKLLNSNISLAGYDPNLYCGVLLGALGDRFSLSLLDEAYSSAPSKLDALTALHRLAIVHSKRFGNQKTASDLLKKILSEAVEIENSVERLEVESLAFNALAMLALKNADIEYAFVQMHKATEGVREAIESGARLNSRLARYYLQEIINESQLYMLKGDVRSAYENLLTVYDLIRIFASDYIGEYYGVLAVIAYKLDFWKEAISKAVVSGEEAVTRGSPIALRANRKVIISSLIKMGHERTAESIIARANSDIIGIKFAAEKEKLNNVR